MRIFWIFFVLPTIAFAQNFTVEPWQIMSIERFDWNEDGVPDRVYVVSPVDEDNPDVVDLLIYLSTPETGQFELVHHIPDITAGVIIPGEFKSARVSTAGEGNVRWLNVSFRFQRSEREIDNYSVRVDLGRASREIDRHQIITYFHDFTYMGRPSEETDCFLNFMDQTGIAETEGNWEDKEKFTHDLQVQNLPNWDMRAAYELCAEYEQTSSE